VTQPRIESKCTDEKKWEIVTGSILFTSECRCYKYNN
jgi:hypothetical protein